MKSDGAEESGKLVLQESLADKKLRSQVDGCEQSCRVTPAESG